jgi:hypothetical protein
LVSGQRKSVTRHIRSPWLLVPSRSNSC